MKTTTQAKQELGKLVFSKFNPINNQDLLVQAQKVKRELDEIDQKKLIDYEKLKTVVKL